VNVCSSDILLKTAAMVEDKWPLTHGPFFSQLALYDPKGFFSILKEAAESPTKEDSSKPALVAITLILPRFGYAKDPFLEGFFPIFPTVKYFKFKPLDFALRLIYSRYMYTMGFKPAIRTYPISGPKVL
jgi:hypothetical protein